MGVWFVGLDVIGCLGFEFGLIWSWLFGLVLVWVLYFGGFLLHDMLLRGLGFGLGLVGYVGCCLFDLLFVYFVSFCGALFLGCFGWDCGFGWDCILFV